MASTSKLQGLVLSQKANQPASPPTFLTGMSSSFTVASAGFGMGGTLGNIAGASNMSNAQNMPTTYSLQAVKEHSIQEEEHDQLSIAVREASEAEELEMITEVVAETKKRHKDLRQRQATQKKQQNIARIYQ